MSGEFCGSFGINTKVGFVASGAIDGAIVAPDKRIEILGENFVYDDVLIGGRGITGSINPVTHHLRKGQQLVTGGVVFEIGPNELDPWIKALCANTAANQTKSSFDTIAHDFTIERELVTHGYRYNVLRQAVISGRSNPRDPEDQIVQMGLSFLGVTEQAGVTFPGALALPTTDRLFWIMADSVLDVDGTEFPMIGFEIAISYQLIPLFRNQMDIGCFRCIGRQITLGLQVPYSAAAATALFGSNEDNLDITLTLNSDHLPLSFAAYETVFNFPTMRRMSKKANTDGKGEIPLIAQLGAFEDAGGTTMSITNTITA